MASTLSRLSWTFLIKRNAHLSRYTATVFTERYTQIQSFHSQQQRQEKRKIHEKRAYNLLTYTVLTSGFCYAVYKWKNDIWEGIKSLSAYNYPIVHASHLPPSGNDQNRDKYNFIADVVEISAPSVVYIEVKDRRRKDVFTPYSVSAVGGSGFIVSHDGLILTSAHVVLCKPNAMLQVKLHDGSVYTAVIEDVDVCSDLATIRINKTNLPVMKLGNSSDIRPGEFVVAIGCPLTLSNTITSGVVSSVNRPSTEIGMHNLHIGYIQTDAAITFGNSGGPLVNLNGEAIGINQLKITAGISFAIPIDYAKEFLKKVEARRNKGKKDLQSGSRKRYLGMTMQSLMPDILVEIQQDNKYMFMTHGVLVWKIIPGSPADIAGIQPGDIITYANKEPVMCSDNIYKLLEKPGTIHFQITRGTTTLFIDVNPEDIV